jgi:hypothetical protein
MLFVKDERHMQLIVDILNNILYFICNAMLL